MERTIIVIGASAGGVSALQTLVAGLPQSLKASLFIVLHIPASWPSVLPQILSRAGPLPVLLAAEGMVIEQGNIYVAPSNHHLMMQEGHLHLETGAKEHHVRPAATVLFRSAAHNYGARVVGVVLTGSGQDGADGLLTIKQYGGVAVVQAPHDASFPSMPLSAIAALAFAHHHVDYVIPLSNIAPVLIRLVSSSV
jgi:two-component system, chemotaxis family, protein-glutamate methylesterase/glutaminase